jgi:hypothetical protein
LGSRLREEINEVPDFIVEQALKDLKLVFISKRRYFVVDQPEVFENSDDIQEEWYTTAYEILENIYFENSKFWDKEILHHDIDFIDYMLELFITCQHFKTTKEWDEFRRWYSSMAKWIAHSLSWREDKYLDDYLNLLEKHQKNIENFSVESDPKKVELEEGRDNYAFKFITIHIAMFWAQNINSDGKFTSAYYNASYVLFLRSFIKVFHSK